MEKVGDSSRTKKTLLSFFMMLGGPRIFYPNFLLPGEETFLVEINIFSPISNKTGRLLLL